MSNPFDQFAVDVQAALPAGAPGAPPPGADPRNPFGSVFADAPAPPPAPMDKPVMNTFQPPPQQQPMGMIGQPPMGGMGMYGQPPAPPPQEQAPQQPPMGGMGMYGQPPAPPPPQEQPPMVAMGGAYGQPPAPGADMYGQPQAPPQQADMFGQPPAPPQQPPAPAPGGDTFAGYGAPVPGQPAAMPPSAGPPGPPPASPNPYGVQAGAPLALPPSGSGPSPNPYGAPAPVLAPGAAGQTPNPYGAPAPLPGAGVPQQTPNPYGAPPAQAPPAYGNPYGAPPHAAADPFGAPTQQQPLADPGMGALVVSNQPSNPYAQALPPQQQQQMYPPQQQAPPPPAADPFAVFESAPAPPPAAPVPPIANNALVSAQGGPTPQQPSDGDLWGDLGFDAPPPAAAPATGVQEVKRDGDLPAGGEYYDARIFTPTLGVMFFKPQELTDSLFLNTDRNIVDKLNERPVVAFIVEGSSARSAGVELGHVLLKVNGVDVKNPKEASRLIKEGPRPLPLLFYVPNTEVVVAEGEHMVKYDTKETTAPNSSKDWKPKYVVIGGIIAQPWMMNMYRSKSEYDIAVIETQARRPVSVKVKQFSLQGARIQNDWQGPQMVKYKNKLHPWKYIVCLPVARNPIKISSPNLAQLKPVHEGIRRVLLAQQRSGGRSGGNRKSNNGQSNNRAPPKQRQNYNQPPPQQQMQPYNQPPPQQQYPPQQQQYGQPPPQQQYPPQSNGYGQPPPQNNAYGQPQPQPQNNAYGQPQPQAYGGYPGY